MHACVRKVGLFRLQIFRAGTDLGALREERRVTSEEWRGRLQFRQSSMFLLRHKKHFKLLLVTRLCLFDCKGIKTLDYVVLSLYSSDIYNLNLDLGT